MPETVTGPAARVEQVARLAPKPPIRPITQEHSSDQFRPRILVVDDEANIRLPLSIILRHAGYEATLAASGEAALSAIAAGGIDLVLLDVGLPDIGGCEVCRTIRMDPSAAMLPVVMLSARTSDIDVAKGMAAGANSYLPKPFTPGQLIAAIERLTGGGAGRRTHA